MTLSQEQAEPVLACAEKNAHHARFLKVVAGVDEFLERYVSQQQAFPQELREAMLYSLQAGGKRLRPALLIFSCLACGGSDETALPAAAAMEMIHTFSLIHDDLPAMDDDDLRRGKPTNHKVYGEGLAILAGDALTCLAFEVVTSQAQDDRTGRRLCTELARATGGAGMIGGQVVDLAYENRAGSLEVLQTIHLYKTARLFCAACRMGGIAAGAEEAVVETLGEFGTKLGLAFQIADDLLDVVSDAATMGKQTQKDDGAGKLTYPALIGIEASRQEAAKLMSQARRSLSPLSEQAGSLIYLADYIEERTH